MYKSVSPSFVTYNEMSNRNRIIESFLLRIMWHISASWRYTCLSRRGGHVNSKIDIQKFKAALSNEADVSVLNGDQVSTKPTELPKKKRNIKSEEKK